MYVQCVTEYACAHRQFSSEMWRVYYQRRGVLSGEKRKEEGRKRERKKGKRPGVVRGMAEEGNSSNQQLHQANTSHVAATHGFRR